MISLLGDYKFLHLKNAWHLVYYIPGNRPPGSKSESILRFKERNQVHVNKWCQKSIKELKLSGVNFDYIVRALGSAELKVSGGKSLDDLGNCLAKELNCKYIPNILEKSRITPPMHKIATKPERKKALHEAYFVSDKTTNLNGKNVLIIDDVTTASITITEMLRALRAVWQNGNYSLFCLARTSRDIDSNNILPNPFF